MVRLTLAALLSLSAFLLWLLATTAVVPPPDAHPTHTAHTQPHTYALVTDVLDGDTIVIDTGSTVRYIGINAPEFFSDGAHECLAEEAQRVHAGFVLGKRVRLEHDVSDTDQHGRLLRYVYVDDARSSIAHTSINELLVREGYATARAYPPDTARYLTLKAAEEDARANARGIWSALCE